MSEKNLAELVSPDGKRIWKPANTLEATNLRARGWSLKPADAVEPDPALAGQPSPPADKAAPSKPRK